MKISKLNSIDPKDELVFRELFSQVTSRIDDKLINNLQRIIDSPLSALVVAEEGDQIVGAMIVNLHQKVGSLEAKADEVVIDQHSRGQGLSKQMMNFAIEWAKSQGATYMELTSGSKRTIANKLYQSLGFKVRDTNVYKLDF